MSSESFPSNIKIIGVTGGIGSGKSTFSKEMEKLGAFYIDGDQLSREVVKPGSKTLFKIVSHFGEDILDGKSLNRKKLGKLIFENPQEKTFLEELLHPQIKKLLESKLQEGPWPIVYEATLLFEAKHDSLVDITIAVISPKNKRVKMVMSRDNAKQNHVNIIMESQNSDKWRVDRSDIIIENNSDLSALKLKAEQLWRRLFP
jgi:dephospho-CoA kinase